MKFALPLVDCVEVCSHFDIHSANRSIIMFHWHRKTENHSKLSVFILLLNFRIAIACTKHKLIKLDGKMFL